MTQSLDLLAMAQAAARHAAARQAVVAQNVANADTPGYKARDLPPFAEVYEAGDAMPMHATRPGHLSGGPEAGAPRPRIAPTDDIAPNGNTVSLETEMLRSVEANRAHSRALTIYGKSLDLIRLSLGRAR